MTDNKNNKFISLEAMSGAWEKDNPPTVLAELIAWESDILEKEYGRRTLTQRDVAAYLGIGLNSTIKLMRQEGFPVLRINSRKVVPITAFVYWYCTQHNVPRGGLA